MNRINPNKNLPQNMEDDGLRAAKGLVNGVVFSTIFWIIIVFIIYSYL